MSLTIGLDLGTSSVKAAAVGPDGKVEAEGAASFDTHSLEPLQAEQDPADWIQATRDAMQGLAAGMAGRSWVGRVRAIGLTGQLPTLVALGDDGPLARAISWKDGRADDWAAMRIARGEHYARTGMPIDGRYLAPMFAFHLMPRALAVRTVLSAKDYLLFALTGSRVTEPSTAAGYGVYDLESGAFAGDLCEFWRLPRALLPEVRPANTLGGLLHEQGASLLGLPAGLPVSTGAADSACAAFALAGLDEDIVSVSFGSSAVIFGNSAAPRFDERARYLLTPHVEAGWYGREMDLLASGTGYRWLSSLFRWSDGELDRLARASPRGARGLTFAPYLGGGEQGALWNPRLRGVLAGLDLGHTPADIARAYLEGVFFEVRRCVEVLAESVPVQRLHVGGGMVTQGASLSMLADLVGRPVARVSERSPAAVGAALLARRLIAHPRTAVPSGEEPRSLPEAVAPDSRAAHEYDALYRRYLARAAACE